MGFSERIGLRPANRPLQLDSVDKPLRTAIYNYLHKLIVGEWWFNGNYGYGCSFGKKLWTEYWRQGVNEWDDSPYVFEGTLRDYLDGCSWNEVYDLLEFCFSTGLSGIDASAVNGLLERDMSGYRIRDGIVVPITDEAELGAIDEALGVGDSFDGARKHIRAALEKLSQRPEPDLRNAITEAVSAVESAARVLTGKHKATLGDALKVLEKDGHVHPALKDAWLKLYGYTSDEDGLRHAMIDDPEIDFATAKYLVVSCAAFVNLLSARL